MSTHVLDRLSAYLDDELSPEDRSLVDGHLAGCPSCARRLETLGMVDAAVRELPVKPPPGYFEAFPGRVRRRLVGAPAPRPRALPVWTWAVAAAALLAVIAPLTLIRLRPTGVSKSEEAVVPPSSTAPARLMELPTPAPKVAAPALSAPPADTRAGASAGQAELQRNALPAAQGAGGRAEPAAPGASPPAGPATVPPAPPFVAAKAPAGGGASGVAFAPAPPTPLASASDKDEARRSPPEESLDRETAAAGSPARARATEKPATAAAPAPAEGPLEFKAARRQRDQPSEPGETDRLYRSLASRSASTAEDARVLRDSWRSFAQAHPEGAPADEARVRVIELGARAYELGSDPADLSRVREDARAYLGRTDAPPTQMARVRAVVDRLSLQP